MDPILQEVYDPLIQKFQLSAYVKMLIRDRKSYILILVKLFHSSVQANVDTQNRC